MPFPNVATQFAPGNPGGPGRPRKRPRKIRGTPWLALRQPDVDFDAQVELWASQIRAGQWMAVRQMIGLVERGNRDELRGVLGALNLRLGPRLARSARPARDPAPI